MMTAEKNTRIEYGSVLVDAMKSSRGNIQSFSTLQPGLKYFGSPAGYIAHRETPF